MCSEWDLTAIGDDGNFLGCSLLGTDVVKSLEGVLAGNKLTEDDVLAIEMGEGVISNEEL